MGLDAVELVMEVEDHFGITIRDDEAVTIRTVRDLVDLCRDRIVASKTTVCFSLPCFLALRRTTREVVADSTFRVRPRSNIADLLPWESNNGAAVAYIPA